MRSLLVALALPQLGELCVGVRTPWWTSACATLEVPVGNGRVETVRPRCYKSWGAPLTWEDWTTTEPRRWRNIATAGGARER